ncbi:hypothetical protein C8R45DRAFT_1109340 [Mycena sanguinolenta]|nr:hypothetical protein C8R45DRAFT_1109340 [Mycena sanguinolenta]
MPFAADVLLNILASFDYGTLSTSSLALTVSVPSPVSRRHTRPLLAQNNDDYVSDFMPPGSPSTVATRVPRRLRFNLPCAAILSILGLLAMPGMLDHANSAPVQSPSPLLMLLPAAADSSSSPAEAGPSHREPFAPLDPASAAKLSIDNLYARQSRPPRGTPSAPAPNFDKWFE